MKYLSFGFLSTLLLGSTLLTNITSANSDSIFTIEGLNLNQEHISSNGGNNGKDGEYKVLKEKDDKDIFDVKDNKDLRKKNFEEKYNDTRDVDLQILDFNLDGRKDILHKRAEDNYYIDISKNNGKLERNVLRTKNPILIFMKNGKPYLYNLHFHEEDVQVWNGFNINDFLKSNKFMELRGLFNSGETSKLIKQVNNGADKFSGTGRYFLYNKNRDSNKTLFELKSQYGSFTNCNIYIIKKYEHYRKDRGRYNFQPHLYYVSHNDLYYKNYDLVKKVGIEPINSYYIPICNQTGEETGKIFDESDLSLLTQSGRKDMNGDGYNDLYFYNFQTGKIEWYIFKKNINDKYIYFEYDNSYSTGGLSTNDSYSKKGGDVMKSSNPDGTMNIQIYGKDGEEVGNISNIHDFEFKDFDNDGNKELFTFENYVKNGIEYKKMKIYVLNSEGKYEEKLEEKIVQYKVLDINGVGNKELIYTGLDGKSKIAYYKNGEFEIDSNIFGEIELRDLNNDGVQEIVSKKKINGTNYYQFDFFKTDNDGYQKLGGSGVIGLSLSDELGDVNNDGLTDFVINKGGLGKVIYTKTTGGIDLSSVNGLPFLQMGKDSLFKTQGFFIGTDGSNNAYFVNFIKDKENPEVISNNIFLFEYKPAHLGRESFTVTSDYGYSRLKMFNKNNGYVSFQGGDEMKKTGIYFSEFETANSFNLHPLSDLSSITKNDNDMFGFQLNNGTYGAYINGNIIITKYSERIVKNGSNGPVDHYISFLENGGFQNGIHWNQGGSIWNWDSANYFSFVKLKNDGDRSGLYLLMLKKSETKNLNGGSDTNFGEASFGGQKIFNLKPDNTYNIEELTDKKDLFFTSNQKSNFGNSWSYSYSGTQYLVVRKSPVLLPYFVYHQGLNYDDNLKRFQYRYVGKGYNYLVDKQLFFDYLNGKHGE